MARTTKCLEAGRRFSSVSATTAGDAPDGGWTGLCKRARGTGTFIIITISTGKPQYGFWQTGHCEWINYSSFAVVIYLIQHRTSCPSIVRTNVGYSFQGQVQRAELMGQANQKALWDFSLQYSSANYALPCSLACQQALSVPISVTSRTWYPICFGKNAIIRHDSLNPINRANMILWNPHPTNNFILEHTFLLNHVLVSSPLCILAAELTRVAIE